jgi:hypothetical protein
MVDKKGDGEQLRFLAASAKRRGAQQLEAA